MISVRIAEVIAQTLYSTIVLVCRLAARFRKKPEEKRIIFGRTLADLLQRLGPAYIKFGQILATRWDLLPPEIIGELQALQDATAPLSFAAITKRRGAEFGFDVPGAFSQIDEQPLASGSISCVYKCVTFGGQRVAVKIRRPNISRIIAQDVACAQAAARILSRVSWFRNIPLVAVTHTFCCAIENQLDFTRELRMMRRLRTAFGADQRVIIPEPVEALCGPAIITMELIDEFCSLDRTHCFADDVALSDAARAGLRALYRMIFVLGLVHCDLHGGNVRLLSNGRVAIVDFGLIAEMEQVDRLRFAEFFYSVAAGDGRHSAAVIVDTAIHLPLTLAYDNFEADIVRLVDNVGVTPATFSVAKFTAELFEIQRRHGITGSPKFTLAILSLFVYEGIVRNLLPDLDFQREAQRYIFLGSFLATQELSDGGAIAPSRGHHSPGVMLHPT